METLRINRHGGLRSSTQERRTTFFGYVFQCSRMNTPAQTAPSWKESAKPLYLDVILQLNIGAHVHDGYISIWDE